MALFMDYHEDLKLPAEASRRSPRMPVTPGPTGSAYARSSCITTPTGRCTACSTGRTRAPSASPTPRSASPAARYTRSAASPGQDEPNSRGQGATNEHPRIPPEGPPGRCGASRRAKPPAPGGAASGHDRAATSRSCRSRRCDRSGEAPGPAAVPPRYRVGRRGQPDLLAPDGDRQSSSPAANVVAAVCCCRDRSVEDLVANQPHGSQ